MRTPAVGTPDENNKDIIRLLKKVNGTHTPLYLDIESEPGAMKSDCFPIVQRKVEAAGGKMVLGWQLWETNNIVEAEFHAVWEDPDGELHDITPKDGGVTQILFVEDENLVYDGRQKDNIRRNTTTNPLVDDFIKVSEAEFRFLNKGERADLYELRDLTESQYAHLSTLKELKGMIGAMILHNAKRKSRCPCPSGLAFKDCHGKNLANLLAKDL